MNHERQTHLQAIAPVEVSTKFSFQTRFVKSLSSINSWRQDMLLSLWRQSMTLVTFNSFERSLDHDHKTLSNHYTLNGKTWHLSFQSSFVRWLPNTKFTIHGGTLIRKIDNSGWCTFNGKAWPIQFNVLHNHPIENGSILGNTNFQLMRLNGKA